MTTSRASCPARAALAGNPSDGFGGAVFGVPLRAMRAEVLVTSADQFTVDPTANGTPADLHEFADHVRRHGVTGIADLVLASVLRLRDHLEIDITPVSITVHTEIPRSVGLAGSSAIIIATLRCLLSRHRPALLVEPDLVSALALSVETDVLGLHAGLQDRVVQTYEAPMLMEFGARSARVVGGLRIGTYREVDPERRVELIVAARSSAAEASEVPQRALHEHRSRDSATFDAAMSELAFTARSAANAWRRGDTDALGREMDRTFDIRRSLLELRPEHIELVHAAREAGCHANYCGSGGSISVVASSPGARGRATESLEQLGCTVTSYTFGPPNEV